MRYDEAGEFFIREMELKRMYKEIPSKEGANSLVIKQNNWLKRNLFSLTGLYYHLSRYGEDLLRPTVAGSILYHFQFCFLQHNQSQPRTNSFFQQFLLILQIKSQLFLFKNVTNPEHWLKSFERSIADFIPLLPLGGDIKVGIIDYVIKIVGGAVTFGLIAIALRRRFERRYRH